jgi:hypothetical protein
MLSSDILEQQFGPTDLHIVQQTDSYRIIQTIDRSDKSVLELSFVTFDTATTYPAIHQAVQSGASMGKAFRDGNVPFVREIQSVRWSNMPKKLQSYFSSSEPVTIVEVSIFVGPEHAHYCDIVEVYHPHVSWPQSPTIDDTTLPQTLLTFLELL